jgi:DNA-binding transcriptional MerR regulator
MFFSIGELAKKSKISADTIRFYEKTAYRCTKACQ